VLSWLANFTIAFAKLGAGRKTRYGIGAAFVHLSADGRVLAHSVPFGYDGHPIRRAQALAIATGEAAASAQLRVFHRRGEAAAS
jgi:hypothetical protein